MRSIEKLNAANLEEKEMLLLKAGAMEEEIPSDIDGISPLSTNTNNYRLCKCGSGTEVQDNFNYARRCKCRGTGNTVNEAVRCGNIIAPTNSASCLITVNPNPPVFSNYSC